MQLIANLVVSCIYRSSYMYIVLAVDQTDHVIRPIYLDHTCHPTTKIC